MKALVIAAGLVGLSLGIVGAVVFGLDDEDTLVPPAEIVAQEFLRAVGDGRIEAARSMLADDAERATSTQEMRRISVTFRSRIGEPDEVHGIVAERRRDTAVVRAEVEGRRANAELTVSLVREYGVWSVTRIDDVLRSLGEPLPTAAVPR